MVKKVLVILSFSLFLTASSIPPVFADAGGSGATGGVGILTPSCFRSASGLIKVGGTAVFSTKDCSPADLIGFMNALNTFFYRLAIVLAVLMITIGGMQWLLAIGNSGKITQAKETIEQAVLGLILALTAILLFNQIDTRFTNLKPATIITPAITCGNIKDPTSCALQYKAPNFCKWKCTGADQIQLPVLPPGTPWSSGFQNPLCSPGICEPGAAVTGSEPALCESPVGLAAQYKTNPNLTNSPALNALIQCVKNSSAGALLGADSNNFTWEQTNTKCNFTRGNAGCGTCVHKVNSCHYGGTTGSNGAEAVDFNAADGSYAGEKALCKALKAAAAACDFGFINFENDHTHVSTESCDSDGVGYGIDCPN